jgi:hypothetical protein
MPGNLLGAAELLLQVNDIAIEKLAREHPRGKVAEAALGAAKRDGDIQAKGHGLIL